MNAVILIAGVVGLAVAAYAGLTLCLDAWRRREYVDIALTGAGVAAVVFLLLAYGDHLVR